MIAGWARLCWPGENSAGRDFVGGRKLLFVYGTLRKRAAHKVHPLLAKHAQFKGKATFQGKLFGLGRFPGAVPSKRVTDSVSGEVYTLRSPDRLLPMLDEYEGSGFQRTHVDVRFETGKTVRAWIYLYQGPTYGLRPIPSGDYFAHRRAGGRSQRTLWPKRPAR
jgi:gamma-glutamylcyclotransferase (GGCT)/AIG2-like uncharacterized protein YtfP